MKSDCVLGCCAFGLILVFTGLGITLITVSAIDINSYKTFTPGFCDGNSAVQVASHFLCDDYKLDGYLDYNDKNKTYTDKIKVFMRCEAVESMNKGIQKCSINLKDENEVHEAYFRISAGLIVQIIFGCGICLLMFGMSIYIIWNLRKLNKTSNYDHV